MFHNIQHSLWLGTEAMKIVILFMESLNEVHTDTENYWDQHLQWLAIVLNQSDLQTAASNKDLSLVILRIKLEFSNKNSKKQQQTQKKPIINFVQYMYHTERKTCSNLKTWLFGANSWSNK